MRGKLVPQDAKDETAAEVLKNIEEEKKRLVKEGIIRKQEIFPKIGDDEKPYKIPSNWVWTQLANIYYIISPSDKKLKNSDIIEVGEYPVVDQGKTFIAGYTNSKELLIEIPGPVIVFGDHTTVKKYIDFNFVAGADGTKILRPFKMDERYFYTYLLSYKLEGRGYSRHFKFLNENYFALPPLAEQHRIVAKVNELMALCDKLEAEKFNNLKTHQVLVKTLLETLTQATDANELQSAWERMSAHFDTLFCTEDSIDQLKQTILQLAVMGKLVKQDPNDEPSSELLKRIEKERGNKKEISLSEIKENEKTFALPQGWEWIRLQQIIRISSGDGLVSTNMNTNGNIPVYGGNGINGYHDKGNISKPTLVIGRVGYYCGSIHISPSLAWVTDNAFITSFSGDNIYLNFLYWLLKGTNLKENDSATAQPVISGRKVYPIVVALPPLSEQIRIVDKIDELFALCEYLKEKIQKSQDIKVLLSKTIVEKAVQ